MTPSESMVSSSASISSLTSSQQRQQRHTSWSQQSATTESSASPPFSIDQLSILARRASSSSLTISALTQPFQNQRLPDEQERHKRLHDAAHKGIIYIAITFVTILGNGSLVLIFYT